MLRHFLHPARSTQVNNISLTYARAFAASSSTTTKSSSSSTTKTNNNTTTEKYQKLDPVSHVLLRPGMYVGPTTRTKQQLWLPSSTTPTRMVLQEASYIPALYKIFDEIIVNAADNYQRDSTMTSIDVRFDRATDTISVRNDGQGIPVRLHETEQVYVPELVLGNLLTGSNFDDTEGRLTGGAHGFGAKLTNIFSTSFTVETADTQRKLLYTQTWTNNMRTRGEPAIVPLPKTVASDYTMVSFTPDFPRFGMAKSSEFWKAKTTTKTTTSKKKITPPPPFFVEKNLAPSTQKKALRFFFIFFWEKNHATSQPKKAL